MTCAAGVMLVGIRPVRDGDAWWHLKVGEYLLHGGAFEGPDPWNPFATRPFVATQWLPEIVAFQGYEWFGLPAIAWLRFVAVPLLFSALLRCTPHVADPVPALVAAVSALTGTASSWGERPPLVSCHRLAGGGRGPGRTAEGRQPRGGRGAATAAISILL